MTELEAVNTLLSIIGEAPVDGLADLTVNEISDSALARRTLHEVSRDVQAEGWSWNTDQDVELTPNGGIVTLPSNTLRATFNANEYPEGQYVVRGLRVYDRQNQTYTIDATSLRVWEHVVQLDWDDLPHQAQQYIVIRAGRIYADRYLNSNAIYVYTVGDEEYARSMLIRAEESHQHNNMLWGQRRTRGRGDGFYPGRGTRYRRN